MLGVAARMEEKASAVGTAGERRPASGDLAIAEPNKEGAKAEPELC